MTEKASKPSLTSLLGIHSHPNALFQTVEPTISGITLPWFYFGMTFSTFCWHVEDLHLYSININHSGEPKLWYSVSHTEKDKLDEYFKQKYSARLEEDPDFLYWVTLSVNPKELVEAGFTVFKTIQYAGEIVVTLPKAYHSGFSLGMNIGEAVNFAVNC